MGERMGKNICCRMSLDSGRGLQLLGNVDGGLTGEGLNKGLALGTEFDGIQGFPGEKGRL